MDFTLNTAREVFEVMGEKKSRLIILLFILNVFGVSGLTGPKGVVGAEPASQYPQWGWDLYSRANPAGLMAAVNSYGRWFEKTGEGSTYFQAGGEFGISPSMAEGQLHLRWKPLIFLQLQTSYHLFRFFGTSGSLLSFASVGEPFGADVIEARKGEEEATYGKRLTFTPTLFGKVGPLIGAYSLELTRFWFQGIGPFFYEAGADTLLASGDQLTTHTLRFFLPLWDNGSEDMALLGPYWDQAKARLVRKRVGATLYVARGGKWLSRIIVQAGQNLADPNRKGQLFIQSALGGDF